MSEDTGQDRNLICFPHAGGNGGSYLPWLPELADRFHVWAAATRGSGLPTAPERHWRLLTGRYADDLAAIDGELVLYGHSMGTLYAYETARELRRRGRAVAHLVVSGREAPHRAKSLELPEDPVELVRRVAERYGGVPREVLAEPELMQVFGADMRDDFLAHGHYRWHEDAPLDIPVTAVAGADDTEVAESGLREWSRHTAGPFASALIPGGHFFTGAQLGRLFELLRSEPPGH
ncbi:surfactin synthase thioesterase subunit [Spinactinospora alkalitolerans]|uniref:Surfactin synthase thioesterase subunit n=1 Tax=Spinactinospora alkalitolerans TaxID=687207 RepID=A0A852U129_9ACTN|nr:alpha/beta fold hydrolase [Spinactinospora alkalitolerans]NYE49267.1 surfactin synthase thioesterase subunit [Spinactinospora alkalitolerans]